jgi:hypothetical protein
VTLEVVWVVVIEVTIVVSLVSLMLVVDEVSSLELGVGEVLSLLLIGIAECGAVYKNWLNDTVDPGVVKGLATGKEDVVLSTTAAGGRLLEVGRNGALKGATLLDTCACCADVVVTLAGVMYPQSTRVSATIIVPFEGTEVCPDGDLGALHIG